MLGRYDSWRLACFLAKQQDHREPTIFAELEARGISADGIAEMLALATWAGELTERTARDASDVEAALELAAQRQLLDARDIEVRRRKLHAYA